MPFEPTELRVKMGLSMVDNGTLFARPPNIFQWHRVFACGGCNGEGIVSKLVFEGKFDDCRQIQRVSGNPAATSHLRASIRSTQGRTD